MPLPVSGDRNKRSSTSKIKGAARVQPEPAIDRLDKRRAALDKMARST
jgi:hypothetical protein